MAYQMSFVDLDKEWGVNVIENTPSRQALAGGCQS